MNNYIYLHGFASGPQSYKGQWLRSRFQDRNIDLQLLDLNQKDFAYLTLTRQINQVTDQLKGPTTLIGSSLGGLTAVWIAQQSSYVTRLVLLAPAFNFLDQWLPQLGAEQLHQWKTSSWLSIYHYGLQTQQRLHYGFVQDAKNYDEQTLRRSLPTLILHGKRDKVIALAASQRYAAQRPWIILKPLDTDHGMADSMADIWQAIQDFCQL
ncbi:MAG: YqiA/YcfP family alpha/beta fold hydrolase [Cyanobacteria bacterium P01_C01_bin.118]